MYLYSDLTHHTYLHEEEYTIDVVVLEPTHSTYTAPPSLPTPTQHRLWSHTTYTVLYKGHTVEHIKTAFSHVTAAQHGGDLNSHSTDW